MIAQPAEVRPQEPLTAIEEATLGFIRGFYRERGVPPSLADIYRQFRIPKPTAHDRRRSLWRKGYLRKESRWYLPL
jgi:DNA-binding IclR family transcriptional regulator